MILINFAHAITPEQQAQVERLVGREVGRLVEVGVRMENGQPFEEQIVGLIEGLGFSQTEWETMALVVNLPGYAPAAACLLAELHGRMGHFPSVVRLRPVDDQAVTRYEVAEVLNLQAQRLRSRARRGER